MSRIKKLPIILEENECKTLISIPSRRYPTGVRNKAILLVMLNMGLRVSEIINLKPNDVNLTKMKLKVVNGKGGIDRNLIIPEVLIHYLKEWKNIRPKSEYFFCTLKGNRLNQRYLCEMVKRYGRKAEINKIISPHTLRHTFSTNFYRQTKDIETLRKLLGHSDISTTQIYVTLSNIDIENAMKEFIPII